MAAGKRQTRITTALVVVNTPDWTRKASQWCNGKGKKQRPEKHNSETTAAWDFEQTSGALVSSK
jgi:hypothetical protein